VRVELGCAVLHNVQIEERKTTSSFIMVGKVPDTEVPLLRETTLTEYITSSFRQLPERQKVELYIM